MAGQAPTHGLRQIPDFGFSNAYIVDLDGQSLALIDTGTPGKVKKVIDFLASIGRKPSDIAYIVLTHPDADHSGSAAAMRRATGAKLAIGHLDAPRLSGEKKLKETGRSSLMLSLLGLFMRVERVKADVELKDGSMVGPLTIVDTPGHTDGSISIYKPGEAIFVGDLLRTDNAGNFKLASSRMSRNMAEVRRSVEKIPKLEFQLLLPGHGKPIEEGGSDKLKKFVANGYE